MIRRLELTNFRRHADTTLEFTPDEQLVVISGHNGAGKCLPGDELIWDADAGVRIPIATFVEQARPRTLGYVDGKIRPVRVTAWQTLAERTVVKVSAQGHKLRAAATHPVLTPDGWKVVGALRPGMKVAVFTGTMLAPTSERDQAKLWDAECTSCRAVPADWVVIDDVTPTGEHVRCYDLTVDSDDHAYVAGDGFVTHNSTLVSEALLFAFFGESRHGRRRLDELVRRDAELEGVEVSVTFEASGRLWRVDRRRVEGIGTARLSVDGADLVDGTSAVDAEITKLLGMDAAGFRLAVLARQKELDGLTSLDRSTRRRVLGRLLRIDAVGRAAARANDDYLRAAEILNAFGSAPDLDAVRTELATARTAAESSHRRRDGLRDEVSRLEEVAAATADADRRARAAEAAEAAAVAAAAEASSTAAEIADRAAAARAALDALGSPAAPPRPSQVVDSERARTSATLEGAEAARRAAADREVLERDLADARAAHAELEARLADLVDVDERLISAREFSKGIRAAAGVARDALEAAAQERAVAEAALRTAQQSLAEFSAVGEGVCDRCGSALDAEHLAAHADELSDAALAAHGVLEVAKVAEVEARQAFTDADDAFNASVEAGRAVAAEVEERDRARAELERVTSRVKVLESRLAAPAPEVPDTEALTSALASLDAEFEAARAAEAAVLEAARARSAVDRLDAEATAAQARADELVAAAVAAAVPDELVEARARNAADVAALVEARERLADAREAAAAADGVVADLERRLTDATEAAARRGEREARARLAAHTKVLLRDCHERLSEGLRPALEVSATQLLARLSEGRFPAVKVTGDYDILVSDDGEFRQLGELSGGEVDLVALGVRLALAQVVAERRGSDALGLLVLDEVFGSQDASRRSAILTALRELRSIYGQIFLISHVGGLEDAADRVVDLQLNDERIAVASDS